VNLPKHLPPWAHGVLDDLVPRLAGVAGVVAVVLGGSQARGNANHDSDVDLGLLYVDAAPPDLNALQLVIEEVNDDLMTKVTGFGGWGPWVNGGVTLQVNGNSVDLLYRSIDRYRATIENARNGFAEHDYLQQPPFGFQSTIYLGELDAAVVLWDPTNVVSSLKKEIRPYPPALKDALSRGYHWGAEVAMVSARQPATRGDIYVVSGCISRAIAFLVQALCAANEVYFVSDKSAIETVALLPLCPADWTERVHSCLSVTTSPERLLGAVEETTILVGDCKSYVYT
jgi:predicted nucleotidyltransferase